MELDDPVVPVRLVSSCRPLRAMKTQVGSLIQIDPAQRCGIPRVQPAGPSKPGQITTTAIEPGAVHLRPIDNAVNAEQSAARLEEFVDTWGSKYPAALKLWRSAWAEGVPFLDYDVERRIISAIN